MHKTAVINVVGLTRELIGAHTPRLKKFWDENKGCTLEEIFPAVTCSSQATFLTGLKPEGHGIVGNGWYFHDTAEVGFWKQSNYLIQGEKLYDTLKKQNPDFTCAKMFWWYNMYSSADWSVTPRPHYPADGRKVFDVYTEPVSLRDELVNALGPFPFMNFWGPASGIGSSKWIAESSKLVFTKYQPTLSLVYLPHLDYGLQKLGPHAPEIQQELRAIDVVVGDLLDFYAKHNVRVIILSEYGITQVNHVIHPNRILRNAGLLEIRNTLTWETLDAGASKAFAVVDHQICHIYVKDKKHIPAVAALFEKQKGTRKILIGSAIEEAGLAHTRAGDIILMADPDTWYSYYYWLDDSKAPDFAHCIDIHRKPGYDPVELFFNPKIPLIKLKMAWTLLKKILGFRYYMDVIPLMPELVKGSHGTPADKPEQKPVFITNFAAAAPQGNSIAMTEVKGLIEQHVLR